MHKNWMAILTLMLWPVLLVAQPETPPRQCEYRGTWTGAQNSKGPIYWKVQEGEECCGIFNVQISGISMDSYGQATLKGECAEGSCTVTQRYTSGQLAGRVYTYTGAYDQDAAMRTGGLGHIKGSWSQNGKPGSGGKFLINNIKCN